MGVIIEEITDDGSFETQAASATGAQDIHDTASGPESSETGAGSREALPDQTQQDNAVSSTDDQGSIDQAEALKREGNALYAAGKLQEALDKYTEAIAAAPESAPVRAVYFGNRAACHLKLKQAAEAAQDCSLALDINPAYTKVLLRRSSAFEELDDLERALADAQKVLELEPANTLAAKLVQRLEPVVTERREKLKEEMMGKLKDLGNTVLGKFGLSLDNFKAEKDPQTGSYSIKFSQG